MENHSQSAKMSEEVNIPFRSRLEPGDSAFVVKVPQKFVRDQNYLFGIESITLMPEYQNNLAFAYKLDSKEELEQTVRYSVQLEATFEPNFFPEAWTLPQSLKQLDALLLSINQHFDNHKPPGTILPPLFFDWIHLDALQEHQTIQGFHEKFAKTAYGEEFNPEKHATWLPSSLASMTEMNNCILPTTSTETYWDDIHLRMWIGPNTTVTFPNENLLLALGFQQPQIPKKSNKGQLPFANDDVQNYKCLTAIKSPLLQIPINTVRGTVIHCYTTKATISSLMAAFETNKLREHDPTLLVSDYAPTIKSLGKSINCIMDLEFDESTQKFKFLFPNNSKVDIRVYMSRKVMRQLGFDFSHGRFVDKNSTSAKVNFTLSTSDLEQKAKALIYDTGMVAVFLDGLHGNQSNSHSHNALLATLEPHNSGVLQNRIFFEDVPRVLLSRLNPDMHFILKRFNDKNENMPLGWPVGGYIFGVITGKV